jgi:hypothetical protein
MFRILFLVIAAIILYKLIFDFIIPIYRASRQIKQKFREMNQQPGDQMNGFGKGTTTQNQQQRAEKPAQKDYIDFEELK